MRCYDDLWETPTERIATDDEETATILRAQDGDEQATLRLFGAYVALLRKAVHHFAGRLSRDDAQQAAIEGLLLAIAEFDPAKHARLELLLNTRVRRSISEASSAQNDRYTVSERTLKRYRRIMAEARGDITMAMTLTRAYRMPEGTLLAVHEAVSASDSLEAAVEAGDEPIRHVTAATLLDDADERQLVDLAFSAVDDLEDDVCRLAYGFADYDPLPDAEIGARLGLSRLKTLRTRQSALAKMRSALGA